VTSHGGRALAAAVGYPVPGPPSRISRAVRAVAATAPAARLLARTLRPVDGLLRRAGGGRVSAPGVLAGLPVVVLTTTGARSGAPRPVPLIPVVTPDVFAVLGTNFGGPDTPGWVLNLEAHPWAELSFGGRSMQVHARLLEGEGRRALLAHAAEVYPGFSRYTLRAAHRQVRVFALEAGAGSDNDSQP
jgi:deazaflavin-dependent oxidoreductase (nitroreductase family)